jgi:hypothetical protein
MARTPAKPTANLVRAGCASIQPRTASATPFTASRSGITTGIRLPPICMETPSTALIMSFQWPVGVFKMRSWNSLAAPEDWLMELRSPIISSRELERRMLKTLMPSAPKMSVRSRFFFSSDRLPSLAFSSPKTSMKSRVLPVAWS